MSENISGIALILLIAWLFIDANKDTDWITIYYKACAIETSDDCFDTSNWYYVKSKYMVNIPSQTVVSKFTGGWKYDDCEIYDSKHWNCKNKDGSRFGVVDGIYSSLEKGYKFLPAT